MAIKKCVVLSCVTFETSKIVEPAVSYGADEVHLFHYVRDPESENGRVYTEFYNEVCSQLRDKLPHVRIVEHGDDPVYDFQLMFRDILATISEIRGRKADPDMILAGPDSDILLNSSAGTSEFSAAAIVASMMSPGVSSFTVRTREYTVRTDDIRQFYYKAGKPVGLTDHTLAPCLIPNFQVEKPEEGQVLALKSYYRRQQKGLALTSAAMIQQLKEDGLWTYEATGGSKTVPKQKETMYYQRHFLEVWIKNGWIEKPSGYGKYRLTDNGLIVINTFYVDLP